MIKIFGLLAVLAVGSLALTTSISDYKNPVTKIDSQSAVIDLEIPETDNLAIAENSLKVKPAAKTITLESKNLVVLRGPVTDKSISQIQLRINELSHKLSKNAKIYLVMDTPGGSVFAGMDLIDHLRAIPQKIETITLFSASMGFQIVQNMDTRYITPAGTLMSHRAKLGGLGGQLDGEFESRYKMIKRKVDYLDAIAAKRMGLSVKDYKAMIFNELWVHGFDSVGQKAADEMVNVTCGKSLDGTEVKEFRTFFGPVDVTLAKCPIIRGVLGFSFKKIAAEHKEEVRDAVTKAFENKTDYVKEFILTNKHYKIFK